ncbi:MAG: 3-deoxy-D-manno-octulosonic acid transferase [Phycisphaerales bacterium]
MRLRGERMNTFDLAYAAGAVLLSPIWARKMRHGWGERFGRVPALPAKAPGRARVLLHAVSVGEVSALRELVPMLSRAPRGAVGEGRVGGEPPEIVIAAGTDTGLRRAGELFGAQPGVVGIVRYPLDFSGAVERFLDAVRPDLVALVELEVWPNFVSACVRRGIPVGVINGRLSERSFGGYQRIRRIIGPSFSRLAFAAVQDEVYAQRFAAMGVAPERLTVTDSMKWDAARIEDGVPDSPTRLGSEGLAGVLMIDRARPLVVAGSTGPGEEALLHAACPEGVQLLCAPRKPERAEDAARALPGATIRRGRQVGDRYDTLTTYVKGTDRFLLATIGELRAAYALADVVVLGRSFFRLHGSDPVEPIGLGKATMIGPRFGDFESATRALWEAGGLQISDADRLGADLKRLLGDAGAREEMARRGRECIRARQGASARHAELLCAHLASLSR